MSSNYRRFGGVLLIASLSVCMGGVIRGQDDAPRVKGSARSRAVEAIDQLGGTYGVKIEGSPKFQALVKRLGYDERMFYDLRRVSLGPHNQGYNKARPITDTELGALAEHLALFTGLEALDLTATSVSDRGIAMLPPLPNLKVIRLSRTRVTDGLAESLEKFPALVQLELEGTAVTDEGAAKIQRLLPACKVIR